MSTFNILRTRMKCPRRDHCADMEIECFFGYGNLIDYEIGDAVVWNGQKSVAHGGRPADGNLEGDGYLVCPICGLDAFVRVHVRNDVITHVDPNPEKAPYKT